MVAMTENFAACPYCGKTIDLGPSAKVPWWRDSGGPRASLGCGTLILIAIIVALFSRGDNEAIRNLRKDIKALEKKIDKIVVTPATPNRTATPE